MTPRPKLLAATIVALLSLLLAWAVLANGGSGSDQAQPPQGPSPAATSRASGDDPSAATRVALGADGAPTLAATAVRIRAQWSWGRPAAGIGVCARQELGPPLGRFGRTKDDGTLLFEGMHAGWVELRCDRPATHEAVELGPGETREVTVTVPDGIWVKGIVVDTRGTPVGGAELLLSEQLRIPQLTHFAGLSAADGTFVLKGLGSGSLVGARARGRGTSVFVRLSDQHPAPGQPVALRLVLTDDSATLNGVVQGPDGAPLPGAFVRVGTITAVLVPSESGYAQRSVPVHLTCDEHGGFSAPELGRGRQQVHAYASGYAPLTESFDLERGETREVVLRLQQSATLIGTISDSDGRPAASVQVEVGEFDYPECRRTKTGADGSYRLTDLEAGTLDIRAGEEQRGIARSEVTVAPGTVTRWDWRLPPGRVICGKLYDHSGKPLSGWWVRAEDPDVPGSGGFETPTGVQGTFSIPEVEDKVYRLRVFAQRPPAPTAWLVEDIRWGDHRIGVPESASARSRFVGRVALPDGRGARGAAVTLSEGERPIGVSVQCEAGDGAFATGPLPPGTYDVRVELAGHEPLVVPGLELRGGEDRQLGELRLRAGR